MNAVKVYQGSKRFPAPCPVADDLIVGIDLALKHRLYVSGWQLSRQLVEVRDYIKRGNDQREVKMALYFVDNRPVAIGIRFWERDVQAFCRDDQRRNGYASACIKAMELSPEHRAQIGLKQGQSAAFWRYNQIASKYGDW